MRKVISKGPGTWFSKKVKKMVMFWPKKKKIKQLQLWRSGKLNFTYHGKLRHRSTRDTLLSLYCGSCTAAKAAIYEALYKIDSFSPLFTVAPCVLWQPH